MQVFRRERGTCQICWSTTAEGDFELTGGATGAAGLFVLTLFENFDFEFFCLFFWADPSSSVCKWILFAGQAFIKGYCCSYNTDCGKTATGFDCALIPSPSKLADGASLSIAFEGFCGGELSTIANSMDAKTVCCK